MGHGKSSLHLGQLFAFSAGMRQIGGGGIHNRLSHCKFNRLLEQGPYLLMKNISEKGEVTKESPMSIVEVLRKNGGRSYLRIFQGRVVVCSKPQKTVAFFFFRNTGLR